jgi:hypothetical protein
MHENSFDAPETRDEVEITLDGLPVELPSRHRSLNAIRCHLLIKEFFAALRR